MRLLLGIVALFGLVIVISGCHSSLSPASVPQLAPEDSSSSVMKEQNYQAVTQAIAQKQDIAPYLKQQPSLAKKTFGGKTLLFDAAFFGNKDAAKTLLENGAEVNYSTQLGMTALDSAVSSNSDDVMTLLKQHGAVRGKQH
jgi:ankyrin repeat protein